jgi:hypothetical protein
VQVAGEEVVPVEDFGAKLAALPAITEDVQVRRQWGMGLLGHVAGAPAAH